MSETSQGEGPRERWIAGSGARYDRLSLVDHPLAHAVWTRQDTTATASSAHSVAKTYAAITVSLTHANRCEVTVRPAGELATASAAHAIIGLDCHPWFGPRTAEAILQRINTEQIADAVCDRRLHEAVRLLVKWAAAAHVADAAATAAVLSVLAARADRDLRCPLSDRSLRRVIRSTTGLTPARLRRTARASAARRLIQASRLQFAVVAQLAGYSDQPHMTHEFRDLCGYTPRQWRDHTASWSPAKRG